MTKHAKQAAMRFEEACAAAAGWVSAPAARTIIGEAQGGVAERVNRHLRQARRLQAAAQRKPAVSVYGPSQAGKSFLVSVLARPGEGRLVADFPGHPLDYIREINPEGHGESTGVVTRFTTDAVAAPEGFPVRLDLLGEADIALCLVNSFFIDGDQSEPRPEPEVLAEMLDRFAGRAGEAQAGFSADDLRDMEDYVGQEFGRSAYAAALAPFWSRAAEILPGLGVADRAECLSVLWGGHAGFTALYRRLAETLRALGHAATVHAGIASLVPRETSIIDVRTLREIATGASAPLDVRTEAGKVMAVPRSILCALTAELVLPMRDCPHDFFAGTDLLDFPGARNRFDRPLALTLADEDGIAETLLRGKVSYLFDRCVARQDITGMLLCIPGGNMETVDLPRLVDRWIGQTHGAGAANRSAGAPSLIFVMTKFDELLVDSATGAGEASRFERRVQASLLEKFGRGADPWVAEWRGGQPFRNCLWLRNPNYWVEALYDYDAAGRETMRADKAARMEELRRGFLSTALAAAHFENPAAAWEAALSPNDGGVSHILATLTRCCDPLTKDRQIVARILDNARGLRAALGPYHAGGSEEERIAMAQAAADAVIDDLETALGAGVFASLLSALMVGRDDIERRISRLPELGDPPAPQPAVPAAPVVAGMIRPRRAATPVDERPRAPAASPRVAWKVGQALQSWALGLERFVAAEEAVTRHGLHAETASSLSAALVAAAERLDLRARLAAATETVEYGVALQDQARPASAILARQINDFVATFGQGLLPEAERVAVPVDAAAAQIVFRDRPRRSDALGLPAEFQPSPAPYWNQWVFALARAFEDNARGYSPTPELREANSRLGGIIESVRAVEDHG